MEPSNWASEHSDALRECFALKLSCLEAATAINRKFNTSYSRNAAIGRAKRMGLTSSDDRRKDAPVDWPPRTPATASGLHTARERHVPDFIRPIPVFERADAPKLRCVEIEPRHLSLVDLETGDCRYPYGGEADGEPITFCAHPRRQGSSYCTPHFHLTLGPGAKLERLAGSVSLRVVEAA